MIQIFNRSHYEDILITRVHKWCDDETAKKRMKAINDFEELLQEHNDTHILKFYLHISPEEQHERLTERMKDPAKMWKYNEKDFEEAKLWDIYMKMYEDCFKTVMTCHGQLCLPTRTGIKNILLQQQLHELLKSLNMKYPGLKKDKQFWFYLNHGSILRIFKFLYLTLKPIIMGMLKEFKEFAMKGNIVDLAVAVIIGGCIWKDRNCLD